MYDRACVVYVVSPSDHLREQIKKQCVTRTFCKLFVGTSPPSPRSADWRPQPHWYSLDDPNKILVLDRVPMLHEWAREIHARGVKVLVISPSEVAGCDTVLVTDQLRISEIVDRIAEMCGAETLRKVSGGGTNERIKMECRNDRFVWVDKDGKEVTLDDGVRLTIVDTPADWSELQRKCYMWELTMGMSGKFKIFADVGAQLIPENCSSMYSERLLEGFSFEVSGT